MTSNVVRVTPENGPTVIRKRAANAESRTALRHECEILRRLVDVDGVPGLIDDGPDDSFSMEVPHAHPLTEVVPAGSVDETELVRLGQALTRIVGAVHSRGVLHRNICPGSLLMSVADRQPVLTDFEQASLLLEDRVMPKPEDEIVGSLPYVSPEQTGRTGRFVDQRSDLYSLGATLYELATGRPPFGTGDPLRLTHDHVARLPKPPAEVNPRLSRSFSAVVMRLLEKEPDARYQSAESLAYDLTLVAGAAADARPQLGTRDFPNHLRPPATFIGREQESEALTADFEAALRQRARGTLIEGPAGVGKGALAERLRPLVTANAGWMVAGRYEKDRQDNESDAGWQALRSLGRLLLAQSEEDVSSLRRRLRDALGSNAGLMAGAIEELRVLLDVSPEYLGDSDVLVGERRWEQASIDLVRAVVSTGRPMVVLFADIQWAGPVGIGKIDGLLNEDDLHSLFVVCTYREADVGPEHPLTAMLEKWRHLDCPPRLMHLGELSPQEMCSFLQEMLRLPPADADRLARAVRPRSRGNPYDTVELVNALRRDGVLVQDDTGWSWNGQTLRHHVGRGDVEEIMSSRLDALPDRSLELLEVMACLGLTVEVGLLADASGEPVSGVQDILAAPLADGLVEVPDDVRPMLRFAHSRVREAVLKRLDGRRRERLQRDAARRLSPVDRFTSVAANQYVAALDTLDDPAEKRQVIGLLGRAASDVRSINAPAAERFLRAAIRLLQTVRTAADGAHMLALHTDLQAVLNSLGHYDTMDQIFHIIQGESTHPLDVVDAVRVQINSLCDRGREAEGLDLGLDLLRRLGIDAPHMPVGQPNARHWRELYGWVEKLDVRADLRHPLAANGRNGAIAKVIEGLTAAAFFTEPAAAAWLVFESQRRWVSDGPHSSLAATLGLAPAVLAGLRQDYHTGDLILRHVLAVSEARHNEPTTSFLRGCKPLFASHWFTPLENSISEARGARDGLMKAGDFQDAGFTYAATLSALLDTAATIDAVEAEAEEALDLAESTGNRHAAAGLIGYRQLSRALRGQTNGQGSFTDESFDEQAHLHGAGGQHPIDASIYRVTRCVAAAVFDDLPALVEHATATKPLVNQLGGYWEALGRLFQALAMAGQIRAERSRADAGTLAELDAVRQWFAQRAHQVPTNFRHLLHLIDAERAWSLADHESAVSAFESALTDSESLARPWHQAFIRERSARYHLEHGQPYFGRHLMTQAWRGYGAWGASAKVAQLEEHYGYLRGSTTSGTDPISQQQVTSNTLDLRGLLEASQALSSERTLQRLQSRVAEILREMTGATDVQIYLWSEEDNDWVNLKTAGRARALTVTEAAARGELPLSAFRYAERTREPLLVDDATRDERFADDPYFRGREWSSLLVEPVLLHSEFRAMLVLENSLSRGAFATDRLDAVKLIVGQLSVSLENALMYSSLERSVSQRTKELQAANARLELLATTDDLTGLANRRHLIHLLETELLRSLREGSSMALMMVDIDHFKLYNDRYGHLAGDECLRMVSEGLQRGVRTSDTVARYGGEEFTIVMSHTDLADGVAVAERARDTVSSLGRPHSVAHPGTLTVTVSIGVVSSAVTKQTTVSGLLAAADAQLYQAKGRGRNQVRGISL